MAQNVATSASQGTTLSTTRDPLQSSTLPSFLRRLTGFEADIVTTVIGGFIFIIGSVLAICIWKKRQSEKRHHEHKIHGHLQLSLSVTTDVDEPYTALPIIQNLKAGTKGAHTNDVPD